jgi:hypothetical protein
MPRFTQTLRLAPVPWYFAVIYRCRGMRAPTASTPHELAALMPYRARGFHRRYATSHGFFWLPCVLCERPFGGHEIHGSIPDPTGGEHSYIGVCPVCTRTARTR